MRSDLSHFSYDQKAFILANGLAVFDIKGRFMFPLFHIITYFIWL